MRRDQDGFDFSGPFVRGDRADRHLGLAWGDAPGDGTLRLFRGACGIVFIAAVGIPVWMGQAARCQRHTPRRLALPAGTAHWSAQLTLADPRGQSGHRRAYLEGNSAPHRRFGPAVWTGLARQPAIALKSDERTVDTRASLPSPLVLE